MASKQKCFISKILNQSCYTTVTRSRPHAFAPMHSPVDIPPQPEYISSNASSDLQISFAEHLAGVLEVPYLLLGDIIKGWGKDKILSSA